MRNIGVMKLLVTIFVANIIESYIAPILIKAYINIPITFLLFSFAESVEIVGAVLTSLCVLVTDIHKAH